MAPSKTRAAATLPTINDDAKYKTKYKELKGKITEMDEDNSKLQLKILKSKKAIQRLRIERAILYDRLQSTVAPSNPFSLHTVPHLASLASSARPRDAALPPTILEQPSYQLADPSAPSRFLQALDGAKLRAVEGAERWGDRPEVGIAPEVKREPAESAPQPLPAPVAVNTTAAGAFPVVESAPGGMPLPPHGTNGAGAAQAMDVDA